MHVLNLFRRNGGKWHEVRWHNGQRQIFMALRFATRGGDRPPVVEKLRPPEGADGAGRAGVADGAGSTAVDESLIVREIETAVAEYNRMNQCALRVAAIRHRVTGAAEPIDFGMAARKLLNLL